MEITKTGVAIVHVSWPCGESSSSVGRKETNTLRVKQVTKSNEGEHPSLSPLFRLSLR